MRSFRFDILAVVVAIAAIPGPAFASQVGGTPAPIAGLGIGAAAAIGIGYRALKRRIGR